MLQILYRDSLRPEPWKEEKVPLKLQMESKPKLKLFDVSLELVDDFILLLRDVFYVPSLNKLD
jgi:hypothetical protein